MQSDVTATTHHATSSQGAASAVIGGGASVVNGTASVSRASVTRMARVHAHQGTVGSSAGRHVPLGSTVKTAAKGELKNNNKNLLKR